METSKKWAPKRPLTREERLKDLGYFLEKYSDRCFWLMEAIESGASKEDVDFCRQSKEYSAKDVEDCINGWK